MLDMPLLFGVITLPALAPLLALLQLLFPGLLGDHWKHYRSLIAALMTQSTLMFGQWAALTWFVKEPTWWLTDRALAWGMMGAATVGLVTSLFLRPRPAAVVPARIEFIALGISGAASGAWLLWEGIQGVPLFNEVLVVTLACGAGLLHLLLRTRWARGNQRAAFATETICLFLFASGGGLLAGYIGGSPAATTELATVQGEWTTYRANIERTGALPGAAIPAEPQLLWTFTPPLKRGEAHLDSSPIVVDGLVFASGYSQVLAYRQGFVWCVNARPGRQAGNRTLAAGELIWQTSDESLRPIFSSPTLTGEKLLLGEGYHFDAHCRLLALDARCGRELWSFKTTSHVESTPTLSGGRIHFGAGDDGVYCLEPAAEQPRTVWHVQGIHSDAGPLVADGKVFVGGVVGELVNDLQVLAVDAATGEVAWRVPTDLPVPAAPSYHAGGVLLALGNGKMNQEHAKPQGAVWRLSAETGDREWEFPVAASVLTSPIVSGDHVYFVARNGAAYALDAKTGVRLWQVDLNEPVIAAPIVSGGQMIVVTCTGNVHALDLRDGGSRWSFDKLRTSAQDAYSSPALADGKLYLALGGKLHCLGDVTRP